MTFVLINTNCQHNYGVINLLFLHTLMEDLGNVFCSAVLYQVDVMVDISTDERIFVYEDLVFPSYQNLDLYLKGYSFVIVWTLLDQNAIQRLNKTTTISFWRQSCFKASHLLQGSTVWSLKTTAVRYAEWCRNYYGTKNGIVLAGFTTPWWFPCPNTRENRGPIEPDCHTLVSKSAWPTPV